jgi:hypothetical protein
MKFGLDLFEIPYALNTDLKYIEDEIQMLRTIWQTKQKWDKEWAEVENTPFRSIKIENLEDIVDDFQISIKGWDRYKEVIKWECVKSLFSEFENITNSLDLVELL